MNRLLLVFLLLPSLCGCSFQYRTVSSNAVGFNLALERAQNKMLMLNIVRAMKRRPRHYTALTLIRGNISQSASASFALPFGNATSDPFSANPNFSVSSAPNFDVAVLDSQKFIRGINTPIAATTLRYMWESNWSPEILMFLLINEIRTESSDGTVTLLRNYPPNPAEFAQFVELVHRIAARLRKEPEAVRFEEGPAIPFGPPLPASQVSAEGLAKAKEQKLLALADNGKVQLVLPNKPIRFNCPKCLSKKPAGSIDAAVETTLTALQSTSADVVGKEVFDLRALGASGLPNPSDDWQVEMRLRSTDAIVQFLGELAREHLERGLEIPTVSIMKGGKAQKAPLFVVKNTDDKLVDDDLVTVDYDGTRYRVPDGAAGGRSGTCLSLLANILALYKESEDLPTTTTVFVSGAR